MICVHVVAINNSVMDDLHPYTTRFLMKIFKIIISKISSVTYIHIYRGSQDYLHIECFLQIS